MALVVQKYGGSSVADADGIKRVARRVVDTKKAGNDVVVIVSAMGDTTDDLLDLAGQVSPTPPPRELDMLLTAGERMSAALLAMATQQLGVRARSFTGSQAGVITTEQHGDARIIDITPSRITSALADGDIAIIAGFQGVSQTTKDITTLGRGASDTTAVALAAAMGADVCEIYTDVDGVFTADPRIVPTARKIDHISYEEMLEMAACGAKVLHLRCVEYARRFGIPVHVRSSFSTKTGTWVTDDSGRRWPASSAPPGHSGSSGGSEPSGRSDPAGRPSQRISPRKWVESADTIRNTPRDGKSGGEQVEQAIISGVAHDRSEAKITVVGVPDKPGKAAAIFEAVAAAEINLDMIVQNVSAASTGLTDVSFTLPKTDGKTAVNALEKARADVGFESLLYDDQIGKVSLIGAGMRSHPGVSARFFAALAASGVNIEMISTSEIRISVVTRADDVDSAVRAVHTAFGLDSDQVEAVVYGGTGR